MKFAKDLERDLVPEWRAKYLDYKAGKKKIKAIKRAIQKSSRSPHAPSFRQSTPRSAARPPFTPSTSGRRFNEADQDDSTVLNSADYGSDSLRNPATSPRAERQPLRTPGLRPSDTLVSYGSIIATPPMHGSDRASFELPDPALDPEGGLTSPGRETSPRRKRVSLPSPALERRATVATPSNQNAGDSPADRPNSSLPRKPSFSSLQNLPGAELTKSHSKILKTLRSLTDSESAPKRTSANPANEVDKRQDEFFEFMESELEKINDFYLKKEKEATERLKILRDQLHIMRDQRVLEVMEHGRTAKKDAAELAHQNSGLGKLNGSRLKNTITGKYRFGKNTRALTEMATPRMPAQDQGVNGRRDFSRHEQPLANDVSYRTAKHKLKYALQELHRGMELLKDYAVLNRQAFRKMNKKYDKAVNARPMMRFMEERVDKADFVKSGEIEKLMVAVEDLYTRYFARNNRKIALSKLRHSTKTSGDFSGNTFLAGLFMMAGILFAIQALVYANQHLHSAEAWKKTQTSYLLQIYGGYFLIVYHVFLFSLDSMIWTKSKINYAFVFEYDTRHALEWRQLLEVTSFFMFLLGLFMWLNFSWFNAMYIYWPVVLMGATLIILCFPYPVLYHRTRKWFGVSNWRLLLAGLYPVEFRDFFLGDMYCSQTYAMGNIALFFCLYASMWNQPSHCNSSHSRLLGFFTCFPSVLRAFQCIRRYVDTRNAFPHLLNLGKYIFGVLYYATLSMYRIDRHPRFQAVFITFALLNAVYTSVWDLIMDWSLGNAFAAHPFLRENLAFRRAWVYYVAMVINVVIRFNWIFYAIFVHDIQHSAILSFIVGLTEVSRRGIWTIFRVENEHCTNVTLFRASRDVPLPTTSEQQTPFIAPDDPEQAAPSTPSLRHRNRRPSASVARVGAIFAEAHAQDFERRRLPRSYSHRSDRLDEGRRDSSEDSSDEDDDAVEVSTDEDLGLTVNGARMHGLKRDARRCSGLWNK
ncbi:hypothetical protein N7470_006077 [Penicillium chermesinum]|nr:hypothetical protein N7470_006077 [Penicillium chermesinum]